MLSDYANVIAPVIAIINSVIAVSVAHFKPEDRRLKILLLVAAIFLGMAAAGSTIYGQVVTVRKQAAETAQRAQISQRLGEFIGQGEGLLSALRDPAKPAPTVEANRWAHEVEDYLQTDLGPGYVQRFRSSAGMIHGQPTEISGERVGYWNGVYERSTRLQQFSAEIASRVR
jgi:hypothetical protein